MNLLVLCVYGLHRSNLVSLCLRTGPRVAKIAEDMPRLASDELPRVTIQLPLYNEATVVGRLLEAVGRIDYPRALLEIQVLDDSNDETRAIAQAQVAAMQDAGTDIVYVRRPTREGYKAGALDYGLSRAKGDLIAIFDADFVPQASFLLDLVGHFADPRVGVVQARWGHINRDESLLTVLQALMLDGHHLVENRARFGAECFFNFAGTGGILRKETIVDAGGWQHDTITEDLDLSYRAQLRGWKFIQRPDIVVPAELPEEMSAFRAQQYRWAKGTAQTARKLLPRILVAPIGLRRKLEAFFHLTPHYAYPLMVTLSILLLPVAVVMPAEDATSTLLIDVPLFLGSTGSVAAFYMLAEHLQGRPWYNALLRLPWLIALNAGLAPNQARAVIEGTWSMSGEFVRTAKRGHTVGRYRQQAPLPWVELILAITSAASALTAAQTGHWFAAPFAALFSLGFGYVAALVIREQWRAPAPGLPAVPQVVGGVSGAVSPDRIVRAA